MTAGGPLIPSPVASPGASSRAGAGSEKAKENFEDYKRRTSRWAIRMEYALLHSEAYKSLYYGPAIKTLNWFHEKRSIDIDKRKRGAKRYRVREDDISFTYDEAKCRGLGNKKFARALRELHARGFIDVLYKGSGLQKDFSRYSLSNRWRSYGTDKFQHIEFPKSTCYVAREHGRWTGRPKRKSQRPKSAVGQRPKSAVENTSQRQILAAEKADLTGTSTANIDRILSPTKGYTAFDGNGGKKELGSQAAGQDRARRVLRKTWRPPKFEIKDNVAEILRQRPDPRADDRRFVTFLTDQLQEAHRGNLDARRVYADLQHRRGLDEWTSDLFFTIAKIEIPTSREAVH